MGKGEGKGKGKVGGKGTVEEELGFLAGGAADLAGAENDHDHLRARHGLQHLNSLYQ